MPEDPQKTILGHEQYEALCALAAGGLLEGAEFADFEVHLKKCGQCRSDYEELSTLVTRELPQGEGVLRQKLAELRAKPMPGSRQRFLRRARAEGVDFSDAVDSPARSTGYFRPASLAGAVTALVLVTIGLTIYHFRGAQQIGGSAAAQQIESLNQRNAALTSSLAQANESLANQEREIQNLRTQLAGAATIAENLRRVTEQAREEAGRSSAQNVQLADESRNQDKLPAAARDEAARSSQLRIDSEASLVEQQTRITDLTNKLRIASATLDMERQLAAAGKDVRELMAARELHVIDVRDTDPNGKPSDAFGRVFLTEGKSLTFYAFDLNQQPAMNAKRSFEVWADGNDGKNASRSLGFLHTDAKAPGRWVLRVDNPELLKQISGVFVTAVPATGSKDPSSQKMLYAYLGQANHP